jgi:hypothetical protein
VFSSTGEECAGIGPVSTSGSPVFCCDLCSPTGVVGSVPLGAESTASATSGDAGAATDGAPAEPLAAASAAVAESPGGVMLPDDLCVGSSTAVRASGAPATTPVPFVARAV